MMQKVKKVVENLVEYFLGFIYFGFEMELDTNNYASTSIRYWENILNNSSIAGKISFYDDGCVEMRFAHKMRLQEGIEVIQDLFDIINNKNRFAGSNQLRPSSGVGIHLHFSHDCSKFTNDLQEIFDRVKTRIITYEDILFRISSRMLSHSGNGLYVNRYSQHGTCYVRPLSEYKEQGIYNTDTYDTYRMCIRKETDKGTTEFRMIDSSLELWRIESLVQFFARFYAYCVIHKTNLRKDESNINDYDNGEYEYFKLYTFMNQNLQMNKEDIHNIVTLYNGTFAKKDRVHKTKKQRREEVKAKAERQKMYSR